MKYIIAGLTATLLATSAHAQVLNGAGATFPAPLYSKWSEESRSAGFTINYQAVGSGAGQTQIINRTVDFGASDAPLTAERLTQNNLIQVPTVMGSVVVIVNIPGISTNTLRISGQNLVDIFSGKITKWNDPKLIADNPGLKLPNMAIAPVYRADGSGTTFVFVSYLHSQDKTFSAPAVSIKWNAGSGARGNDGVAATVKRMPGSIGYVEKVFATNGNIPTALLKSATGTWVAPTNKTFIAAANKADWTSTNEANVINRSCDECYPIVSATYILIPKDSKKLSDVISWLDWAYKNGNASAISLDFIPLSDYTKDMVIKQLKNQ
jgi:phosphate transport system substrate-binding protein